MCIVDVISFFVFSLCSTCFQFDLSIVYTLFFLTPPSMRVHTQHTYMYTHTHTHFMQLGGQFAKNTRKPALVINQYDIRVSMAADPVSMLALSLSLSLSLSVCTYIHVHVYKEESHTD